jgi:ribonuclease HII
VKKNPRNKKDNLFVIGVDEVGRGPIAGPVAVGAFVVLQPEVARRQRLFRGVKESKQLSPKTREAWFVKIKKAQKLGIVDFAVTFQSEKIIDEKGISYAIKKALASSLQKLILKNKKSGISSVSASIQILLDGGLKAPAHFKNQKTIIRGDIKEQTIALASICAKVLRDRRMVDFAKKYPNYGFDVHKGYGTKAHYKAIKKHGLSSLHRRSFCTKLLQKSGKLAKNR